MNVRAKEFSILIVDDSAPVLRTLVRSADYFGYRVTSASSYEQAVTYLREESFDLVLSDIDLGGHYGTELLQEFSNSSPHSQLPQFIFMTGNPTLLEQPELVTYTVLTKPFPATQLQTILDEHLY